MRVCQSCGRENADERDFCECGEYLRWEPTNFVPAVSAPASEESTVEQAAAEELDPNVTVAADAAAPGRAWGAPAATGWVGFGCGADAGNAGFGRCAAGGGGVDVAFAR